MSEYKEELEYVKRYLEEDLGYRVAYIALYGSQNYNLSTDKSDIDMRAIVVPTLDQLIKNSKPVSKTIVINERLNTHMIEKVDLKDIRKYFEILEKANPAYVEIFYTEHYLVDKEFQEEFDFFFNNIDTLVSKLRFSMLRALYGMCRQKAKRFNKKKDRKDVFHIVRLWVLIIKYFHLDENYKESIFFKSGDKLFNAYYRTLMKIKHEYTVEELEQLKGNMMSNVKTIADHYLSSGCESKIDYSIKYDFRNKVHSVIKKHVTNQKQV